MLSTIARRPRDSPGLYETVELFAEKQENPACPCTHRMQFATMDCAPDSTGRRKAQVIGRLSSGEKPRRRRSGTASGSRQVGCCKMANPPCRWRQDFLRPYSVPRRGHGPEHVRRRAGCDPKRTRCLGDRALARLEPVAVTRCRRVGRGVVNDDRPCFRPLSGLACGPARSDRGSPARVSCRFSRSSTGCFRLMKGLRSMGSQGGAEPGRCARGGWWLRARISGRALRQERIPGRRGRAPGRP